MSRLGITRIRPADAGALAVGAYGSVFRQTSLTTWESLAASTAAPCVWPALDAGTCSFSDVWPMPAGGFLAVGNDTGNDGVTLTWFPDGGVITTHVGKTRQAIAPLLDGGVVICGWDNLLQVGSPTALVTQAVPANFATGCNTLRFDGQRLVFTHQGVVGELSFDGTTWEATTLTTLPVDWLWASTERDGAFWFGGTGRSIVRADFRDAGP